MSEQQSEDRVDITATGHLSEGVYTIEAGLSGALITVEIDTAQGEEAFEAVDILNAALPQIVTTVIEAIVTKAEADDE